MSNFLTLAIILGLTALLSFFNERVIRLQQDIGLVVLALTCTLGLALLNGVGLSEGFSAEQALVSQLALDDTLLNGVLCFMLFAGSINVSLDNLREERRAILALAIGGVVLATLFIGVALWAALAALGIGLALIYAIVFGALISPTDPIAALAILGKVGLPPKLEAIINGESLFNDGVGVVLFTIALTVALGTAQPTAGDALLMFLREVLGGIALGLAAGAMIHFVLMRTSEYGTQVLISLSVVSLGYGLAEHIEVSGPIAMVVTGLLVGNVTMPRLESARTQPFKTFWQAIDEVLNSMLFVLIGLHLAIVPFDSLFPTATCAVIVCLLARWLSVYIPLFTLQKAGLFKARLVGLTNLLTWGGLRGGLALAMALSLPDSPEKNLILHMTFGVVVFSIVVQGLTVGRIFKADMLKTLITDR